jgi:hypothetical protein
VLLAAHDVVTFQFVAVQWFPIPMGLTCRPAETSVPAGDTKPAVARPTCFHTSGPA